MTEQTQDAQTAQALARVDSFIAAHPDYRRRGVQQPGQGSTNRVLFARRRGVTVVFKVFCTTERKDRESFALRHWGQTGLVPELIRDDDPRMIVMSHLPGIYLHEAWRRYGAELRRRACRETGSALARLTRVPLSEGDRNLFESRFYGELGSLESYLRRILELGRAINARDPDFGGEFWRRSLDFMEGRLDRILSRPRLLYHQDVANMHVLGDRFAGFFDLEMCRIGCDLMQLASSFDMLRGKAGAWELFRQGWEAQTGSPIRSEELRTAAAAHHFLCWREISRYLSYDATPGSGYCWASPADPAAYRRRMEQVEKMLTLGS